MSGSVVRGSFRSLNIRTNLVLKNVDDALDHPWIL